MSCLLISYFGHEELNVESYRYGYQGQLTTVGLRQTNVQIAQRASQEGFSLSVKCKDRSHYDWIMQFVRKHQRDALSLGGFDPTVRVLYPEKGIDFSGFITQATNSNDRFDFAPKLTLSFELARDNINSIGTGTTGTPSWDSIIYGGVEDNSGWSLPGTGGGAETPLDNSPKNPTENADGTYNTGTGSKYV